MKQQSGLRVACDLCGMGLRADNEDDLVSSFQRHARILHDVKFTDEAARAIVRRGMRSISSVVWTAGWPTARDGV